MTRKLCLLAILLILGTSAAQADPATEKEVRDVIVANNMYTKKNLKGTGDVTSKDGSMEFWSSGGLLQQVPADTPAQEFESFRNDVKHIHVITLVPGKAAMAHYYSEGSFQPKGQPAVSNYLTRVTQVFLKEGGSWKVRGAHWSPIAGGSGTKQTSLD